MADDRLLHKKCGHSAKVTALPNVEYEVWIGYLLSADDFGVMRASAVTLQADHDRLAARSKRTIERSLEHLVTVGLLRTFEHQGRRYVYQHDWQDWQKREFPSRTINPKPPDDLIAECSERQRFLFQFHPGGKRLPSRSSRGEHGENLESACQELDATRAPARAANANANAQGEGGTEGEGLPKHAFKGRRFRVPRFLHDELVQSLGAKAEDFDLPARYLAWDAELERTGEPIGDALKWVRARCFKEAGLGNVAAKMLSTKESAGRHVPDADRTKAYLQNLKAGV